MGAIASNCHLDCCGSSRSVQSAGKKSVCNPSQAKRPDYNVDYIGPDAHSAYDNERQDGIVQLRRGLKLPSLAPCACRRRINTASSRSPLSGDDKFAGLSPRSPSLESAVLTLRLRAELKRRGYFTLPSLECETEEMTLDRFLRARGNNVEKAADMLEAHIKWREEVNINQLRRMTADEVLCCDHALVLKILPSARRGVDRSGKPLIFKYFGQECLVKSLMEFTTMENLVRYNIWMNEQHELALRDTGNTKWTVIVDVAGWNLGLCTKQATAFTYHLMRIDAAHYPERLDGCIIVNAPPTLAIFWNVAKKSLDPVTQKKVDFISFKQPKLARERLLKVADVSQLPKMYGGTAEDFPRWPTHAGIISDLQAKI